MGEIIRRVKNAGHLFIAFAANIALGFPSRGLIVIGVTGTDGKTTTSNLIYHILKESGKKAAVISTISAIIDGVEYKTGFHVTTPSPYQVQKYLKMAKKRGCTHVVLEVTSHALDQSRVWGIPFEVGALTNITHEHLDYHKNYERYVKAKLKLLMLAKHAVVNSNGEWFGIIKKAISESKMSTYSLHGVEKNDVTLLSIPFELKTKLIGDFNLENILAATVACQKLGIENDAIARGIATYDAPVGRQEEITGHKARVIVDFAHTPNAFENFLPEIRKRTTGKIIHVFGSAGERDRRKRSEMGKVAAFYDDVIVLTAEDPRSEKIRDINNDIKKGIPNTFVTQKQLKEIDDRKEAIIYALDIAMKEDTVIITGKGHEESMNFGQGEIKWSDQNAIKEYVLAHDTTGKKA